MQTFTETIKKYKWLPLSERFVDKEVTSIALSSVDWNWMITLAYKQGTNSSDRAWVVGELRRRIDQSLLFRGEKVGIWVQATEMRPRPHDHLLVKARWLGGPRKLCKRVLSWAGHVVASIDISPVGDPAGAGEYVTKNIGGDFSTEGTTINWL